MTPDGLFLVKFHRFTGNQTIKHDFEVFLRGDPALVSVVGEAIVDLAAILELPFFIEHSHFRSDRSARAFYERMIGIDLPIGFERVVLSVTTHVFLLERCLRVDQSDVDRLSLELFVQPVDFRGIRIGDRTIDRNENIHFKDRTTLTGKRKRRELEKKNHPDQAKAKTADERFIQKVGPVRHAKIIPQPYRGTICQRSCLGHGAPMTLEGSNKPQIPCLERGLSPVLHIEPGKDAGEMILDRAFGDVEGTGDLFVGSTSGDMSQNVEFPRRK